MSVWTKNLKIASLVENTEVVKQFKFSSEIKRIKYWNILNMNKLIKYLYNGKWFEHFYTFRNKGKY